MLEFVGVVKVGAAGGAGVGSGDGGNEALIRRMRAHANYGENAPIVLILLALLELAGGSISADLASGFQVKDGRVTHEFLARDTGRAFHPL